MPEGGGGGVVAQVCPALRPHALQPSRVLQAWTLEWVATSFSNARGYQQPNNRAACCLCPVPRPSLLPRNPATLQGTSWCFSVKKKKLDCRKKRMSFNRGNPAFCTGFPFQTKSDSLIGVDRSLTFYHLSQVLTWAAPLCCCVHRLAQKDCFFSPGVFTSAKLRTCHGVGVQ